MIGKRFNRLTVIGDSGKRYQRQIVWNCLCDCGNTTLLRGCSLKSGATKSCGCLNKELLINNLRNYKHGDTRKKLYGIWNSMKTRCYNVTRRDYKSYGKRKILVCDEWKDNYSKFRFWAILNGYQEGLTIDRINNDDNYKPSNCQWLTRTENTIKGNLERRAEK